MPQLTYLEAIRQGISEEMERDPSPPCPRCGRTVVELYSRRDVYQRIRGHGPPAEQLYETVYVFKCHCVRRLRTI